MKGINVVLEYITKGLEAFNAIVGELDKQRLINYGEKKVEVKNYEHLNKLISRGLAVRRDAEMRGVTDDGYRRS